MIPLRTAAEAVDKITRAFVGAGRMLDVLTVERDVAEPEPRPPSLPPGVPLHDARSGLVVEPGLLTCLVSADPDEAAAIADRLGRFGDDDGVVLGDVGSPTCRRTPCGADRGQRGRSPCSSPGSCARSSTLGPRRGDDEILAAVSVANAEDVLDALPGGASTPRVDERGRSFSGGQRQRLVLARALLSDAEMLVLVEPTSAVDAHTEARIARRLREARRQDDGGRDDEPARARPGRPRRASSRTAASSPRAATASCCARTPGYRDTVTRGEDE